MPFHTLCIHLFAVLSYSVPVALLISWELVNMSLSWECLLPAPQLWGKFARWADGVINCGKGPIVSHCQLTYTDLPAPPSLPNLA